MNIVLIYGGRSGEHEMSLISCASVARNVASSHKVKLIGITKDVKWYLQDDAVLAELKKNPQAKLSVTVDEKNAVSIIPGGGSEGALVANGKVILADVVFPVMHGTYSEDGTIQGLLEMANLAYVGCGVFSSSATMDKEKTKILWEAAGLPVVPYVCLTRSDINDSRIYDKRLSEAIKKLHFPLFVKPCSAGSSDGASKASNEKELSVALLDAFQWDDKVLIEKAINAQEIECAVTGNAMTAPADSEIENVKAYGPGEIVLTHEFYDYNAKYNDADGVRIPADAPADVLETVRRTAVRAYKVLDASGLSRVDFFRDRDTGKLYLNEINTLPGFTSISMFPKMCDHAGLHFTELTDLLIDEAVARYRTQEALQTSR